jgi:hypothetical protein
MSDIITSRIPLYCIQTSINRQTIHSGVRFTFFITIYYISLKSLSMIVIIASFSAIVVYSLFINSILIYSSQADSQSNGEWSPTGN